MENHTITVTITEYRDIQHSPECINNALFFHETDDIVLMFGPFVIAALSAALTGFIRMVTPGVVDAYSKQTPTPVNNASNEAGHAQPEIPASNHASEAPAQEEPPPYQPSSQSVNPPDTQPTTQKPKAKRSSAYNFVVGTFLFISNLIALFLIALLIQGNIYCAMWSPLSTLPRVMWWTFFGIIAFWASFGAMCWLMLLRNLWGPRAVKKFPIQEYALIAGVFFIIFLLPILVGQGLIKAIQACQKRFCGDSIDDDEEALELEEGGRVGGYVGVGAVVGFGGDGDGESEGEGEGEGEGSEGLVGVRDEERVGLMSGMKD